MTEDYVRVRDVARVLDVSQQTIRNWLKAGLLHGRRVGRRGHWFIEPAELRRLLGRS